VPRTFNIAADSDSDESVDVPDSESDNDSFHSTRRVHNQQYCLPNNGVANVNMPKIDTSAFNKNQSNKPSNQAAKVGRLKR
jgi:hypothetical protein